MSHPLRSVATLVLVVLCMAGTAFADFDYTVKLKSGDFVPKPTRVTSSVSQAFSSGHVHIQFEAPVTDAQREQMAREGIVLQRYIPNLTYVARVESAITADLADRYGIRWFDRIAPVQKIAPEIAEYGILDWAKRPGNMARYVVVLHADVDASEWMDRFATEFDAEDLSHEPSTNSIELTASDQAFYRFSEIEEIHWIELASPLPRLHNNGARVNTGAEVLQAAPWNLSGAGVVVAEWDGGLVYQLHVDFGARVTHMESAGVSDHATHVAGTIMGDGTQSNGVYRGMAPAAELRSYQWWGTTGEASSEYSNVIQTEGARISNNSWGYGPGDPATQGACVALNGAYWTECTAIDNIVRGSSGGPITIMKSAGNARSSASDECGSLGWNYNTVAPWETSKNIIAVGAINSDNSSMTSFSSWGPCDDGRIKPDIVGPGCESYGYIRSTSAGGGYTNYCGTSMSTPALAGVAALLYERWDNAIGTGQFLPSTLKGILINTAIDLGAPGPDFAYGHGMADAVTAAEKIGFGDGSYAQDSLSTGSTHEYDLTVPGGASKLKVTLVWDDPGGISSASQHLVNDLDLVLVDPFTDEEFPWILDPDLPQTSATKGVDRLNNVETVEINNPTPGLWKAKVIGYNIPTGPQTYSLVFTPDGISTPGNLSALAVFDEGDLEQQPAATIEVVFQVTNVGATEDTVSVDISDDLGWLTGTIVDSVVALSPWDSSEFVVEVLVPSAALAGHYTAVTCAATSLPHSGIDALNTVDVVAGAYYDIDLSDPPSDISQSPDTVEFSLNVSNLGNDTDLVTLTLYSDSDWTVIPDLRGVTIDPKDDTLMTFSIVVPAEAPDGAVNTVTIDAAGNHGGADIATFEFQIDNPNPPPALVLPEDYTYIQDPLPSFEWDGIADEYTLYIATNASITDVVRTYPNLTSTSFAIPGGDDLPDGGYYWAVRLYIGADSSSLQRYPRQFIVDNIAPDNVIPVDPEPSEIISTLQPTFQLAWESTPGDPGWATSPETFFIEVASDTDFVTPITTFGPSGSQTVSAVLPLDQGVLYYRGYAVDSAGNYGDTSYAARFLVDVEPPVFPIQQLPNDGARIGGDTITFTWASTPPAAWETAGEYYYLHVSNTSNFTNYTFTGFMYESQARIPGTLLTLDQEYFWRVKAFDSAGHVTAYTPGRSFTYVSYVCGDVNEDGNVDLSDILQLASYAFLSGDPVSNETAADVNCDTNLDLSDILQIASYAFLSGDPLPCCD